MKLEFLDRFSKNNKISSFVKIRPLETELFHADRQTDRHDDGNSRFSQFCERTLKLKGDLINLKVWHKV